MVVDFGTLQCSQIEVETFEMEYKVIGNIL